MGRFDDLMLSGDIVRGMLSVCVRLFVISFVLMIAFSVVLKRMNAKYRIPVCGILASRNFLYLCLQYYWSFVLIMKKSI